MTLPAEKYRGFCPPQAPPEARSAVGGDIFRFLVLCFSVIVTPFVKFYTTEDFPFQFDKDSKLELKGSAQIEMSTAKGIRLFLRLFSFISSLLALIIIIPPALTLT